MTAFLAKDADLEQLEDRHRWEETILYCWNKWEKQHNCENTLRLLSQIWFLCDYIEQLPPAAGDPQNVPFDWVKNTELLSSALDSGDLCFIHELRYLCLSGHMMITSPEWFVRKGREYHDVREEGQKRLDRAKAIDAKLAAYFYGEKAEIRSDELAQLFPGGSEVDLYYRSCGTTDG